MLTNSVWQFDISVTGKFMTILASLTAHGVVVSVHHFDEFGVGLSKERTHRSKGRSRRRGRRTYQISIFVHSEPVGMNTKIGCEIVIVDDFQIAFPDVSTAIERENNVEFQLKRRETDRSCSSVSEYRLLLDSFHSFQCWLKETSIAKVQLNATARTARTESDCIWRRWRRRRVLNSTDCWALLLPSFVVIWRLTYSKWIFSEYLYDELINAAHLCPYLYLSR